jgi:hypothetical protein
MSRTRYGHIPALQTLDDFEIVAIASRKMETAQEIAAAFGITHAFDDEQALIDRPDIDLVVILTPALDHARLARLVIARGKDVYSEWPLSTTTAESEELLALAEAKGVRHVVGLQRRFGPSSRYLRDLIAQGYIGEMRSASMTVNVDAFGDSMPSIHSWSFDAKNFGNTLSVYRRPFPRCPVQRRWLPKGADGNRQEPDPRHYYRLGYGRKGRHDPAGRGDGDRHAGKRGSLLRPDRGRATPPHGPADRHHRDRRRPAHHQRTGIPKQ